MRGRGVSRRSWDFFTFWSRIGRPSTPSICRVRCRTCSGRTICDEGRGRLHARQAGTVAADVVESGILVLNEIPIKGWRVRADGTHVSVVPVNVIQAGVSLETGHSSVGFPFRPRGVRLGRMLSLCGLAAMFALVVGDWKPMPVLRDRPR
jgi:hypothetical protein